MDNIYVEVEENILLAQKMKKEFLNQLETFAHQAETQVNLLELLWLSQLNNLLVMQLVINSLKDWDLLAVILKQQLYLMKLQQVVVLLEKDTSNIKAEQSTIYASEKEHKYPVSSLKSLI